MDALQTLYDSQVSEDDAVAVFQCSQQYDDAVDVDESGFRVVSIATTVIMQRTTQSGRTTRHQSR